MEIYVTRFNELTYRENKNWLLNHNEKGCIYGSPVKISTKILPNTHIIVLEMNNSTNKIEGIGIIKNKLACDKKYKIYSDNNYNRFIYKSKLHISRDSFTSLEDNIIINLEKLLFKSRYHCKRGQGIQSISKKIIENKIFNFIEFINNIYNSHLNNK
tara:strand:- start:241 stop:711 length:471 start_codon:yes stop_codon:yes gene_type:complete